MIFSVAVFALPFLAQSVLAGECVRKYTIKENDICDSISAANNVSTYQLSAINVGIIDDNCSNLIPGKEICIGYAKEDCATTYIVKSNDSCDDIASAHGLNSTILYLNNPQINQDCSNIYIGEVLCTSKQVQVPPAPGAGFVPGAVIPVTAEPAKPPKAPAFAPEPAKPAPTPKPTPQAPAPQAPPAPAPPAPSPAASSSSSLASSSAAPAPSAPADEEDDDDLPFCDEL